MARLAKRPQVVWVVCAAAREWEDVVDFLHRRQATLGFAVFTKWVLGNVGRADLAPRIAVAFVDRRVALKLAVVRIGFALVGFTVLITS